jgi:hypothetical protein
MLDNESIPEPLPRLNPDIFINPCLRPVAERTEEKHCSLVTNKNIWVLHLISFLQAPPAASQSVTTENHRGG